MPSPSSLAYAATTQFRALPGARELFEFADLRRPARDWVRLIGPVCTIALLAVALRTLGRSDVGKMAALLPSNLVFWGALTGYLSLQPLFDFAIFRYIWPVPPSGFVALVRKMVTNEVLLGYLGELQFYAWARRHGVVAGSAYGAVKDVAVLSAVTGNVVTLILLVLAWPYAGLLHLGAGAAPIFWSSMIVLGSSLTIALMRNRIFSLPQLVRLVVAALHIARALVMTIILALLWHLVLPSIDLQWWFVMAAGRQLLTRLPFLPNKDLVFASLATALAGPAPAVTAVVVVTGTLIFLGQMMIGGLLEGADLARRFASANAEVARADR